MKQEISSNLPANLGLIINLAMLMSTLMILLVTFLLPPNTVTANHDVANSASELAEPQTEGNGSLPPSTKHSLGSRGDLLFYLGLVLALLGLVLGHVALPKGPKFLVRQIIAMCLVESCSLMGLVLHVLQGDVDRSRSLILLGIVGIGSFLLNHKPRQSNAESI